MRRASSPGPLLLPLLLVPLHLVSACRAGLGIREEQLEELEGGELDPCRVTFVCLGMLSDLGVPWSESLCERLADEGRLGLVVEYFTGPLGAITSLGGHAPAARLAQAMGEIEALHEATGCPRPLAFDAVGFSFGCEVILQAAGATASPGFDRVVFFSSSSFCLSYQADCLVEASRIGSLVNFWSPLDVLTLPALGAGSLSLANNLEEVENRITPMPHVAWLIESVMEERIVGALLEVGDPGGPAPSPEFRRRLVERLSADDR